MGLLDDLEKEAERQREEESRLASLREQRELIWQQQLEPATRALEAYLKRLTEQLSFLKKKLRAVLPIHGYGDVVTTIEPSFVLRSEGGKNFYEIVLEMVGQVVTDECPVVIADNLTRVRSLAGVLQQYNLGGMSDTRKNPNGDVISARFQARGKVPMMLTVRAELDSCSARFTFNNLEGFGQSTRNFTPEQLDDALFDSLGRFLTREDTRFAQESISDDMRKQLQTKLQRDEMRREWEHKLSRQLGEDEAKVVDSLDPAAKPGWLLGRLRLLSVKMFGR